VSGWPTFSLGSLCEFKNGLWTGKKAPFVEASVIRNTNFSRGGQLDVSDVAILMVETKQLASRRLHPGDIILEKSGGGPKQPVGRVALFGERDSVYSFSNFTSLVRIRDRRTLLPEFLHWFLHWQYVAGVTARMQKHTTGIRNLEFDAYKTIEVPVPPLAEQKRIVAILDEAFEGIAKATENSERNLANARELFDTQLAALIDQKSDSLEHRFLMDQCLEFGRGKSKHRPRNDPKLYDGSYPFIQTGDIADAQHIIATYSQSYNELGLAQSKLWPKGTVCIAIVGATIGESGILGFDACFPDSVIGMIANPSKTTPDYLQYLLRAYKTVIKSKGVGSARENINLGTFERQRFPFPALDKQHKIVKTLREMATYTDQMANLQRAKISSLDVLGKSTLDHIFSGRLNAAKASAA
jgi:type I restriction enzyme S subunit